MKKNKKKIILWFVISFLLASITYWYYYFEIFSDTYVSDNLQEININLVIEWNDNPYTISKTFVSRSNYTINSSIVENNVDLTISWVNKQWFVWFELTWSSWEKSSYVFFVKPNQSFLNNDILNYKVNPVISGFNNWSFNIQLNDSEVSFNDIQSTWLNFKTDLFSYDWEYYYSIQSWKIDKFSKNFHHLNTYDIDLWTTWLFVSNITDIKSLKNSIYLRFNNWKILHWTRVGDSYSFIDSWNSYSDIWISNNSVVSPLFLSEFNNIRDYEVIWSFLYILTDTKFEVYYTIWWINNLSLIYSKDNVNNLSSFIVDKWVYLFNTAWDLYIVNNDFQIYYLKDENWINQWIATTKKFANYKPNLSVEWQNINISSSLLSKTAQDIINWYKYTTDGWIPVYNQKTLWLKLNESDFTKIHVAKNLFIDKFSSNYWLIEWDWYSVDINIPIIWYWVNFSYKWLWENINPKLNVWVNDILLKQFNVEEGELYIHLKAYDYGMNSTDEIIKWPIIIRNNNPKIWTPYINTNLVNIDWWDEVRFMFKSNKKLSEVTVTIEDNYKNISTYNLSDLDFTEDYDWYTYIIKYAIAWWTNQLKFIIEWKDSWWNKTSTYYEYNLNSWWFQVLWVSQTNAWIWWNLTKNQKEKWFIYWVASKSNVSSEINTDYKFNVDSNSFTYIPIENDWVWNIIVNHKLLKSSFKVFNWKARKDIDDNFFYEGWDKTKPINDIKFLNWYYYFYDWDLILNEMIFAWDWVLLVNWNLDITWDIVKDLNTETDKYPNNLKIYVTWNINVFSNTSKVDSYLFSNNRLSTLSVAYDLEAWSIPNADNIFKNTDWKAYYDLNDDSKVDLITYENKSNNKKLYNIYIMWDNNKYTNNKLTSSWWLLCDSISYNTSSTNFINWKLVKDIIISNWWIDTTYFINSTLNWLIEQ